MITDKMSAETRQQLQKLLLEHPQTLWEKASRFLTPLTGAFGLVTIFYGFEALLQNSVLAQHPWEMIALGSVLLLVTGSFFTKL